MKPVPKISTVEAIILIFFALLADLINWVPFLNIVSTIFTFILSQIYFMVKGMRATLNLVTQLLEFIPGVSVLPLTLAGIIGMIIIDRNQKLIGTALNTAGAMVPGGTLAAGTAAKQLRVQTQRASAGSAGGISNAATAAPSAPPPSLRETPKLRPPVTTPVGKK